MNISSMNPMTRFAGIKVLPLVKEPNRFLMQEIHVTNDEAGDHFTKYKEIAGSKGKIQLRVRETGAPLTLNCGDFATPTLTPKMASQIMSLIQEAKIPVNPGMTLAVGAVNSIHMDYRLDKNVFYQNLLSVFTGPSLEKQETGGVDSSKPGIKAEPGKPSPIKNTDLPMVEKAEVVPPETVKTEPVQTPAEPAIEIPQPVEQPVPPSEPSKS